MSNDEYDISISDDDEWELRMQFREWEWDVDNGLFDEEYWDDDDWEWSEERERFYDLDRLYEDVLPRRPYEMHIDENGVGYDIIPF